MNTKVSFGMSSIFGYISLVIGAIPIVEKTIESGVVAVHGPEKWLAIYGIIMGGITSIGRYLQAHAFIKATAPESTAEVIHAEAEPSTGA